MRPSPFLCGRFRVISRLQIEFFLQPGNMAVLYHVIILRSFKSVSHATRGYLYSRFSSAAFSSNLHRRYLTWVASYCWLRFGFTISENWINVSAPCPSFEPHHFTREISFDPYEKSELETELNPVVRPESYCTMNRTSKPLDGWRLTYVIRTFINI